MSAAARSTAVQAAVTAESLQFVGSPPRYGEDWRWSQCPRVWDGSVLSASGGGFGGTGGFGDIGSFRPATFQP